MFIVVFGFLFFWLKRTLVEVLFWLKRQMTLICQLSWLSKWIKQKNPNTHMHQQTNQMSKQCPSQEGVLFFVLVLLDSFPFCVLSPKSENNLERIFNIIHILSSLLYEIKNVGFFNEMLFKFDRRGGWCIWNAHWSDPLSLPAQMLLHINNILCSK